jgi:spermidine/putrescine transport system substrate-binding protein
MLTAAHALPQPVASADKGCSMSEHGPTIRVLAPAGMSRRRIMGLAGAALAAGAAPARAEGPPLNLFTYSTYGSEPVIAAGRAKGFIVKPTVYAGADEMMAKLRGGGTKLYDMVVPLHTYVGVAAQAGLLEPMDPARLPNLAQVAQQFRSIPDWSPGGALYGVPFVWGANAMAYDYSEIGQIDSLNVLFDPGYKGRVSMRDDVEDAISVAALHLGMQDPFDLDERALQEIKKVLIAQKPLNRAYWKNIADLRAMFASSEIVAAWATLSVVAPLRRNGLDIRWVWPKEGALGWSEGIAAVKGTRNKDQVEAYANFTLGADYGEALARGTLYATTSGDALKRLPPDLVQELGIQPERMGSVLFKRLPSDKNRWNEIWTEVKAS